MIPSLLLLALLLIPWTAHAKLMGVLGAEMAPCPTGCGLRILSILPGSPAHEVGLRPGDVIKALNGVEVRSDIIGVIDFFRRNPGRIVYLTVFRRGYTATGPVQLGAIPVTTNGYPPDAQPPAPNAPTYPSPPVGTTVINNNFFGNINQENTTNQNGNGNNATQQNRRY